MRLRKRATGYCEMHFQTQTARRPLFVSQFSFDPSERRFIHQNYDYFPAQSLPTEPETLAAPDLHELFAHLIVGNSATDRVSEENAGESGDGGTIDKRQQCETIPPFQKFDGPAPLDSGGHWAVIFRGCGGNCPALP
jgi:hypothetical protein